MYPKDCKSQAPVTNDQINSELNKVKSLEEALQLEFKDKAKMESVDIQSLFFAFLNRSRFTYTSRDIFDYILKCLCIRSTNMLRREIAYKKHYLFEKAEEKFKNELDVVRIVKTLRKFKMLA